jgi:hypothetical protein
MRDRFLPFAVPDTGQAEIDQMAETAGPVSKSANRQIGIWTNRQVNELAHRKRVALDR